MERTKKTNNFCRTLQHSYHCNNLKTKYSNDVEERFCPFSVNKSKPILKKQQSLSFNKKASLFSYALKQIKDFYFHYRAVLPKKKN